MAVKDTEMSEKENLSEHVALCELRYQNLDKRLNSVETKLDKIQQEIVDNKKSLATVIITSAGTIVVALIGVVATILVKF